MRVCGTLCACADGGRSVTHHGFIPVSADMPENWRDISLIRAYWPMQVATPTADVRLILLSLGKI